MPAQGMFASGRGTRLRSALRTNFVAEFRIGMVDYIFFDGQPGSVPVFNFLAMGTNGQEGSNSIYEVFINRSQASVQHLK
jgi:hypothetical protein